VLLAVELGVALAGGRDPGRLSTGPTMTVQAIGRSLFTDYAFPFEVTSVLILVAMVGAVVLARREHR
jgi:NADH-quinone oxidoreductase subunit J